MIKQYSNEKLEEIKNLTIVDFYADWCGPCKMLSQVLEQLENVDIIKINVDENEELAKQYKVMSIPNLLIVKDGEIKKELLGFRSKDDLEEELKDLK